MFELTLSTTIDKQVYLSEIFQKLNQDIRQDEGIIVKQNSDGRAYLALAVNENKKEFYKAKLLDYILFMIIDDYKHNFYKNALISNEKNVVYNAFLTAITIFDADSDKDIIKNQIQLSGELLIDSFFHFKLQWLRSRWEKTAGIINQNGILNNTTAMLDVIKYLTTISDDLGIAKADVEIFAKQIVLKSFKGTKKFKVSFEGKSLFLSEIVKLNPSRINLKQKNQKVMQGDIVEILQHIFGEKIYVINWF